MVRANPNTYPMTTAEKITVALRDAGYLKYSEDLNQDVIQLIDNVIATRSPWIKTSERPPTKEDGHRVFVYTEDKYTFDFEVQLSSVVRSSPEIYPHWMKIPPVSEENP